MKINAISSYKSSINLHTNNKNNMNNRHVSFGFGEDYGSDPYEFDEGSNQSFWRSLGYMFSIPVVIAKEVVENAIEQRKLDKQYEEIVRRSREQKEQANNNPENNVDDDIDIDMDDDD